MVIGFGWAWQWKIAKLDKQKRTPFILSNSSSSWRLLLHNFTVVFPDVRFLWGDMASMLALVVIWYAIPSLLFSLSLPEMENSGSLENSGS